MFVLVCDCSQQETRKLIYKELISTMSNPVIPLAYFRHAKTGDAPFFFQHVLGKPDHVLSRLIQDASGFVDWLRASQVCTYILYTCNGYINYPPTSWGQLCMLLDLYDSLYIYIYTKGVCIYSPFDNHAMIRYCLMTLYYIHLKKKRAFYMCAIASLCHSQWLPILFHATSNLPRVITYHQAIFHGHPWCWGPGVACVSRCYRSSCCWVEGRNKLRLARHVHGSRVKRGSGGLQGPNFNRHPLG